MRNHVFLLTPKGLRLSPAYNPNPIVGQQGLHLDITDTDNALDYGLAFEVIDFFRLSHAAATQIYDQALQAVGTCQHVAISLGISRVEQVAKQSAFTV